MAIRRELELYAMNQAFSHLNEVTLKALESINRAYSKTIDLMEIHQTNREFHQLLYRDIKMPMLTRMINGLCLKLSPYLIQNLTNIERKISLEFHKNILLALQKKNKDAAIGWLKKDLEFGLKRLTKALAKTD